MSTFPSSSEWQIFECQACGSQMKARHHTLVQSRIFCPKCHTPVNILAVDSDLEEDNFTALLVDHTHVRDDSQIPIQSQLDEGYRELPDPELGSETDGEDERFLENLDSTIDRQGRRRVKMRKRRKPGAVAKQSTLTDWDMRLASLPEAEVSADTWEHPTLLPEDVIAEKTRTYAVAEDIEDGRLVTRFKRIRRKRILGVFQAFFRRFTWTTRIAALIIFGFIAAGGLLLGFAMLRKKFTAAETPETVDRTVPDRTVMNLSDEIGAMNALRDFFAATTIDERLKFVRLPRRVKPLMTEWYKDHPLVAASVGEPVDRTKIRVGTFYFVLLDIPLSQPSVFDSSLSAQNQMLAIEEIELSDGAREYRVDWESAVAWQPMSLDQFRTTMPMTPVPMRLKLRESDYYAHGFINRNKWTCAELYYPGRTDFHLWGYIQRDAGENTRQLLALIEHGAQSSVIVNIRYPDNIVSQDQVIIENLVYPSWFYQEDVPPGEEKTLKDMPLGLDPRTYITEEAEF